MATADPGSVDVLIVGAGHNGLVCACYLAAAGLRVRVLESAPVVGGAAVTEEFFPGFRNSTASYTVSLLNPKVIRDLRLAERGLRIVERPFSNFVPLADGRTCSSAATGEADAARSRASSRRATPRRCREYYARLERLADQLKKWVLRGAAEPGRAVGGRRAARCRGGGAPAARLRRAADGGKRDLIDLFTKSAGHWLDATFESEPLKAVLGWDAVVGNYASPYAAGSAYVLLHHCFGEVNGKAGGWGHAIGGMGASPADGRRSACARRADRPRARVQRVLVEHGRRWVCSPIAARRSARAAWCRTCTRSCCTSAWSTRARCRRSSARRSAAIAAARGRCASTWRCRRCPTSHARRARRRCRTMRAASSSRRRSPTWTARGSMRRRRASPPSRSWR